MSDDPLASQNNEEIRARSALREEGLRESDLRYRLLFESSRDAIMTLEPPSWIFTSGNPATVEMFRAGDEATFVSLGPWELSPELQPDGRPSPEKAKEMIETAVREGNHFFEWQHRRLDGEEFPATVLLTRFCLEDQTLLQATVRDITERKQAQEALEREHQTLRQMLQSQDQERQLVAYDIHDGVAQHLTAAMMQFQACAQSKNRNSSEGGTCHDAGLRMLEKALSEARRLISGLRPPILDESGIVAAIGHLIHDVRAQGGPEVEFHSSVTFDRLEPTIENSIYRIVQESLTNAQRHAKAKHVRMELTQEGDTVGILVEDHGIGFDPENVEERCYGLAGIRERARVLGGHAIIDSWPGNGTRIKVELPVVADH